ncbi:MAG TPA: hypothetical protein VFL17_19995, partial [Anaerolineae bacterium]|nr:hypothetical protein [Anaerolineae bacterium]
DWFVYSDGGGGSIQTFAQFETPDQAPPGFLDGNMKIDVGFQICAPLSSDNCQLIGTPVVVAGLPGVAQAHKSELTGAEFRAVALQKGYVTLTIAAHIHGEAERVKAYEQILGYMLSTLRVDE